MSYCKVIVLKDKKSIREDGTTMIYVQYVFDRRILRIGTGERVHPNYFKNGKVTKAYGSDYSEANSNVENIKSKIDSIIRNANFKGSLPTVDFVRSEYKSEDEVNKKRSKDLIQHLEEYIAIRQDDYTFNSIKDYKTLLSHLKEFKTATNYPLTLDKIDNKFFARFSQYLFRETDVPLMTNTVAKQFKGLKVVLNWLSSNGWNINKVYKGFVVKEIQPEVITLSKDEVLQLFNYKFDVDRLTQVRDLFILQCVCGLRYSDIKQITKDKINGDNLILRTIKTKDNLIIPLNKYSKAILNKYLNDANEINIISNQKANDYIKEAAKIAGLNRTIALSKFYGRERKDIELPLHEIISSHTGRRTFVTLSLELGIRPEVVMKITGHKDYKTMKKYLAVTDKSKSKEMALWNNL